MVVSVVVGGLESSTPKRNVKVYFLRVALLTNSVVSEGLVHL